MYGLWGLVILVRPANPSAGDTERGEFPTWKKHSVIQASALALFMRFLRFIVTRPRK